ncbi:AbrB family transcriptional regulator [Nocardia sp. NPDC101769]|uniref:AbrB family transcriptional regulator n=1 Tax=Nocardia sp. NPDC101769 TaxID=3364333 RepID=UPI0038199964
MALRLRAIAGWSALLIGGYWLAEAGEVIGVPAAELILPLLVGAILAVSGVVRSQFPAQTSRAVQAMVGVIMGSYLQPQAFHSIAATALPLILVTVATIALCGVAAVWLARTGKVALEEATLAMAPGGSAAIIACSDDLGADARKVAFAQYLRVGMVALAAPLVAAAATHRSSGPSPATTFGWPMLERWVQQPQGVSSVLVLTAICLLGIRFGERIGLPSPVLLGPMVLAAIVTFTDTWTGFAPDGPLKDVLFVAIGLEVGLRFTRPALRHIATILPRLLVAIVGVCLGCAALAWMTSALTGSTFIESYLATTPGGINSVLATAVASHSDVALISTTQSLRLFIVLLAIPPITGWLANRTVTSSQPEHGSRTAEKH